MQAWQLRIKKKHLKDGFPVPFFSAKSAYLLSRNSKVTIENLTFIIMVSIGPALVAFIANCLGFQLFLTPIHYPTSPFVSSILFTSAVYFTILQFDLYPSKLRRMPWFFTRLYEFVTSKFLLEYGVCNIWFPMETFAFLSLSNMGGSLRKLVGTTQFFFPFTSRLSVCLQHYITGIIFSYIMSISTLLLVLHSTFTIDLGVIRSHGVVAFLRDSYMSFREGTKYLFMKNTCVCFNPGAQREERRRLKYRRNTIC